MPDQQGAKQMQIIAGQKRGAKLATVQGQSVRPTAQRTRESLFNILQGGKHIDDLQDLIVLDLFAGSGALGLEALSRGSAKSYFVEKSPEAIAIIKQNARKLGAEAQARVVQGDCLTHSRWMYAPANLVFCDPPYDKGLALDALANFKKIGAFADNALIVIEARKNEVFTFGDEYTLLDERRYGMAAVYFLRFA